MHAEERLYAPLLFALELLQGHVVALAAHHLQVPRAVVAAVAIDVVHDFTRPERSSQRLLGGHPVDSDGLTQIPVSDAHIAFAGHKRRKRPFGR